MAKKKKKSQYKNSSSAQKQAVQLAQEEVKWPSQPKTSKTPKTPSKQKSSNSRGVAEESLLAAQKNLDKTRKSPGSNGSNGGGNGRTRPRRSSNQHRNGKKKNDDKSTTKKKISRHIQNRPDQSELMNKGIIKTEVGSPKTSKASVSKRKEDLEKKIASRSGINELVARQILPDPSQGLKIHTAHKKLQKEKQHDALNDFLIHRPNVETLVRESVMHDTMTWSREVMAGAEPSPRNCHTSTLVGTNMYLLGGYGNQPTPSKSSELLILDLETYTWSRPLVAGRVPTERYAHVCVAVGASLVMFGGFSVEGAWMSDLNVLDTNFKQNFFPSIGCISSSLEDRKTNKMEQMLMWYQPNITGIAPSPRAAMTAVVYKHKIYFFGGNDGNRFYNDLFVLDTDTMHWSRPRPTNSSPTARAGHSASIVGSTMIIFGGGAPEGPKNDIFYLDLETMEWTQPTIYGTAPSPRAGHTSAVVHETRLIIFGGGYLQKVYNDVHVFETETCTWKRPSDSGTVPNHRGGHTCVNINNALFFFGGADVDGHVFNDLHVLDTAFFRSRTSDMITIQSEKPQNVIPAPAPAPPPDDREIKSDVEGEGSHLRRLYSGELDETDVLVLQIEHTSRDFQNKLAKVRDRITSQKSESQDNLMEILQLLRSSRDEQYELLLDEVEHLQEEMVGELNHLKESLQSHILASRSLANSHVLAGVSYAPVEDLPHLEAIPTPIEVITTLPSSVVPKVTAATTPTSKTSVTSPKSSPKTTPKTTPKTKKPRSAKTKKVPMSKSKKAVPKQKTKNEMKSSFAAIAKLHM